MKIRIQGNSIRIRPTKTEVEKLCTEGYLEESTSFVNNSFVYALQQTDLEDTLTAQCMNNKITMFIPKVLSENWPTNDVIGFDAKMKITPTESLYLLLEKDFKCLDNVSEDQSDNYDNPKQTC